MESMFETKKSENHILLQVLVQRMDSKVSPELKSEIVVLGTEKVPHIIMDLSKVTHCDSSGLSVILIANRVCKTNEGMLVLFGINENVKKLINISQLHTILSTCNTYAEAKAMIE